MATKKVAKKETVKTLNAMEQKHAKKSKKDKVVYLAEGVTYRDLQKAGKETREAIKKDLRSLNQCIKSVQKFQGEWAEMLGVVESDYEYKSIMEGMTEKQLEKFKETSMTSEFVVMEAIRRNKKAQAENK